MNKIIGYLILGIVVILAITLFFLNTTKISSSPNECISVFGGGSIGISILSEDIDIAREYAQFLVNSEPFSNFSDKFSFYYAGESECKLLDGNILFCYNKNSVRNAASCGSDYTIALSGIKSTSRSSAYGNFMSINVYQPKSVLLHEFGHSFGNLADEYVPSDIPGQSKNCQKSCSSFLISEGCFEGCSKSNYFRSSSSSVMRTLSTSNYGELNLKLIENELEKV